MSVDETWNGMNVDSMDKVMTDVLDYADKANKILNNISSIVDDTETCFKCESGDNFRTQYELIKSGIATFNKNFLSYNTDFMRAVRNYQLREETAVEIMTVAKNSVDVSLEQREEI